MSVRLWNFFNGGWKLVGILTKNQHNCLINQKDLLNDGSLNSFKNHLNVSENYFHSCFLKLCQFLVGPPFCLAQNTIISFLVGPVWVKNLTNFEPPYVIRNFYSRTDAIIQYALYCYSKSKRRKEKKSHL